MTHKWGKVEIWKIPIVLESEIARPKPGFPNLGALGIWGMDDSLSWGLFGSIPGFYLLDASRTHLCSS